VVRTPRRRSRRRRSESCHRSLTRRISPPTPRNLAHRADNPALGTGGRRRALRPEPGERPREGGTRGERGCGLGEQGEARGERGCGGRAGGDARGERGCGSDEQGKRAASGVVVWTSKAGGSAARGVVVWASRAALPANGIAAMAALADTSALIARACVAPARVLLLSRELLVQVLDLVVERFAAGRARTGSSASTDREYAHRAELRAWSGGCAHRPGAPRRGPRARRTRGALARSSRWDSPGGVLLHVRAPSSSWPFMWRPRSWRPRRMVARLFLLSPCDLSSPN
jgi:hypothetical protein